MFLHKNSFKLFALMLCVQCSIQDIIFDSQRVYKLSNTKKYDTGVPIAVIYDKSTPNVDMATTVDKAIKSINDGIQSNQFKWFVHTTTIDVSNSHDVVQTIINYMSRGVLAIFGPTSWSSINTLTSVTNSYNIPYLSLSHMDRASMFKQHQKRSARAEQMTKVEDYSKFRSSDELASQIYLRPDLSQAVIELVKHYGWSTVYYVYNYDEAISSLEAVTDYYSKSNSLFKKIHVRRISQIDNTNEMLKAIEASLDESQRSNTNKPCMIIDLDSIENYKLFLGQLKELGKLKSKFDFVLSTLGVNEIEINDVSSSGDSFIGFSVVDYHNINTIKLLSEILQTNKALNKVANIPHNAALLVDGLMYFSKRVSPALGRDVNSLFGLESVSLKGAEIYVNDTKGVGFSYGNEPQSKWPLGKLVLDKLKEDKKDDIYVGLTGPVSFDKFGRRKNFTIGIYKTEMNKELTKIGHYSSENGISIKKDAPKLEIKPQQDDNKNKLIVLSIAEEPFLIVKSKSDDKLSGNERYEGYCVDLTKRLAEMLNFTYELRLVKDGKFGERDSAGKWNGIIGELVRYEADMAVAPLTITARRDQAIDFSTPFMNTGVSIMMKKLNKEKPKIFSFLAPLDTKIWLFLVLSYFGVSLVLFLIGRFSPYENNVDKGADLHNNFTLSNALWFMLAPIMQQRVDMSPRSVSGRLLTSTWWFFTLILISYYTANLVAFLTVERVDSNIESAAQLYKDPNVRYGMIESSATKEFFKNTKVDLYKRMWESMQSWGPSVFVKSYKEGIEKIRSSNGKYAFLMESNLNEYLNEKSPCDTVKVGEDLDSKAYGIATPVGSELIKSLNVAIMQLREEGFLDELKLKWWQEKSECSRATQTLNKTTKALNLTNVAGIFYTLFVGLLISVMVVMAEVLYKSFKYSKNNQTSFGSALRYSIRMSLGLVDGKHENN